MVADEKDEVHTEQVGDFLSDGGEQRARGGRPRRQRRHLPEHGLLLGYSGQFVDQKAGDDGHGEEGDDGEQIGVEIDRECAVGGREEHRRHGSHGDGQEGGPKASDDRDHEHDQQGPQEETSQPERRPGGPKTE